MPELEQYQISTRCPECGGDCVWANATPARNASAPLTVRLPNRLVGSASPVDALTCTRCGYIRLYARRPVELRQ